VAMWELIYHEILVKNNIFRELSGSSSSLSEKHAISKAEIATGEQKVQAIITTRLHFSYFRTVVKYTLFSPKKLYLMI
jgi:hypothetical protein